MSEEALIEHGHPVFDGGVVIRCIEGQMGKAEDFMRSKAVAQGVIQHKVVEVVGTDEGFGFLGDVALLGREQLWADGSL